MSTRRNYLLTAGENWLMLPPRIAALIESRTNIAQLRVQMRGLDPEASNVLEQLRESALSWNGFQTETEDDDPRQPAARSNWMNCRQAGEELGMTRQAISKAIREDRLPATFVGNGWQINRQDVEHYKAARSAQRS